MKRQLTLGVLGHVDHGKTSLVRALTGTDTDRLKEEKARGMSIVPGFAYLEYAGGTVDIVDVPGHEDYVRAMIAGASGIDAALLVVDAREGVRRQTAEHIAIAALLGVRRGVAALSKTDLASGGEARAALRAYLQTTFLAHAPIIGTSARSGAGIAELREAIGALLESATPPAPAEGAFLPVDRVFSMTGHGTVVTGTLRRGTLAPGAEVEVLPAGVRALVRRLQVHGRNAEIALPGQRVGVNLRGIGVESAARGSVVATPGLVAPSKLIEVELTGAAPMPGRAVRVLLGTSDSPARVRRRKDGGVRLACERPLCALAGERFVLRDDAARRTLGGGRVLAPRRHFAEERVRAAERAVVDFVEAFHARHPTREGASLAACRDAVGDAPLFDEALARLRGRLETIRGVVRRAGFDALGALPPAERRCAERLERAFLAGGVSPPRPEDVVSAGAEPVYRLLIARGRLIRVAGADGRPVVFHREAVESARRELGAAYPPPERFTVSQARERLRSTRRFVVPLLEFLDASRFTRRAGDVRVFLRDEQRR